jgi:hypothetical protein
LRISTGFEYHLTLAPSDPLKSNIQHRTFISKSMLKFYPECLNITIAAYVNKFRGFALSGSGNTQVAGRVARFKSQNDAKNALHTIMRERFEKVAGADAKLTYKALTLIDAYKIAFRGWKDDSFPNPTQMTSKAEMEQLYEAIVNDNAYWEVVEDEDDRKAIREELVEADTAAKAAAAAAAAAKAAKAATAAQAAQDAQARG